MNLPTSIKNMKVTVSVGALLEMIQAGAVTTDIKAFLFDKLTENEVKAQPAYPEVPPYTPDYEEDHVEEYDEEAEELEREHTFEAVEDYEEEDNSYPEESLGGGNAAIDMLLSRTAGKRASTFSDTKPQAREVEDEDEDIRPAPRRAAPRAAKTSGRSPGQILNARGSDLDRLRDLASRGEEAEGLLARAMYSGLQAPGR